jgi:DNA-binding response OmpR family regulator
MNTIVVIEEDKVTQRAIDALLNFLSACIEPLEEIVPLESGSEDHVPKPFRQCELTARIRAVLRRSSPPLEKRIRFGDVEIDIEHRYIRRSGLRVKMTPVEYNLLLFFLRNVDQALTRDVILNEVWGYDCYPNTRTVDAHIVKLRRKLEPDHQVPRYLHTIHGVGYRFVMFPESAPLSEDISRAWGAVAQSRVPATQAS